ncbi:hypothetical protein STVIR_0003 [Streptomyces viridochromogenes Tue57]|uniref:Uncharacterized protein n=1 Tax=Streptomyces viridochromogenes Tue57 TaxID=1160705 RepID=L8PSF1_STRVR|nr:hypothetical protein STVIR_0003 [Streptomyces viridochromogenes Tue57]
MQAEIVAHERRTRRGGRDDPLFSKTPVSADGLIRQPVRADPSRPVGRVVTCNVACSRRVNSWAFVR